MPVPPGGAEIDPQDLDENGEQQDRKALEARGDGENQCTPKKTATALLKATKGSITGPPNMGLILSDSESSGFADTEFITRCCRVLGFSPPRSRPRIAIDSPQMFAICT